MDPQIAAVARSLLSSAGKSPPSFNHRAGSCATAGSTFERPKAVARMPPVFVRCKGKTFEVEVPAKASRVGALFAKRAGGPECPRRAHASPIGRAGPLVPARPGRRLLLPSPVTAPGRHPCGSKGRRRQGRRALRPPPPPMPPGRARGEGRKRRSRGRPDPEPRCGPPDRLRRRRRLRSGRQRHRRVSARGQGPRTAGKTRPPSSVHPSIHPSVHHRSTTAPSSSPST